ncbi:hypothetical protein SLS62_006989 [Diatrype stigma]|uniref:BTB domain-containing protein n=1 Tax=Diatrype stigma TaxID=117547 RepID=A0AAN9UXG0_9PEZI
MAESNAYSFISKLLGSGDYSDLTLICDGEAFKPGRGIDADTNIQEAKTNTVNVDFDVATLRRMIQFMYTGDYQVEELENGVGTGDNNGGAFSPSDGSAIKTNKRAPVASDSSESNLVIYHVRMNEIANYYDVPRLVQLANSKADYLLKNNWSTEAFVGAMREAVAGEKGLQHILAAAASQHMDDIVPHRGFAQLDTISPFALELMRILREEIQNLTAIRSMLEKDRARRGSDSSD